MLQSVSRILAEIHEQPPALESILHREQQTIERFKRTLAGRRPKLAVIAAVGTSGKAAQFARYLIEITTGVPVSIVAMEVHTLYNAGVDLRDALVLGISQSGEAMETNCVLEHANAQGAVTVGITNEPQSTLARLVEHAFVVSVGNERSVASTKTYTGQLLMIYLLAYALGAQLTMDQIKRLPEVADRALKLEDQISAMAARYRLMQHAVVLGSGLNYATASEFASKLMETCYTVAEAFVLGEVLHGPIAMLDRLFPVFCFAPGGVVNNTMKSVCEKMQMLQVETMGITDESNQQAGDYLTHAIVIPAHIAELWTPIPYVIPAQLFAAKLASEKGLEPDQPRSLRRT